MNFFPHILNVKSVKQTILRITVEASMDPIDELDSLSLAHLYASVQPPQEHPIESGPRWNATSITAPINLKYVYRL